MRWLIILFLPFILGFTATHSEYDTKEKIKEEFSAVYDGAQPKEFDVVNDTPALNSFVNGRVVIYSSGTVNAILFRVGQDIFAVQGSCITVKR